MSNKSKIFIFIFGVIIANLVGIMVTYLLFYLFSITNNIFNISLCAIVLIGVGFFCFRLWKDMKFDNGEQQENLKINTKSRIFNIATGIIAANLFGMTVIGLTKYILVRNENISSGIYIFSEFTLVPIGMGIICAWFWRKLELRGTFYLLYSLLTGIFAIGLSYIFLGEGYICLIIVSPLLLGFIVGGIFIGKLMFRKKNKTLNVSIISILIFIFITDALSDHDYKNEVSDTIIIHASPSEVWKHVAAFEPITEPNHYFLFKIGMPSPVQSTVDGYYEGAGRKCIFSNGYTFDEKMVVYKPAEELTFDVTNQPRDPEIMGHIDIQKGQFLLHDNGDGTTTLTGNSWYKLYVFPTWYYDMWAQSITHNVHIRVMQHIKKLSENPY